MLNKNYQGQLLASNPNNPRDELGKAVILLVTHTDDRSIGIQINQALEDLNLQSVSRNLGIWYETQDPVWFGGNAGQTKINVVHSLDWSSTSTIKLNQHIGITSDVSVLIALSQDEGPQQFRACSGYWLWENGRLEEQLDARSSSLYKWEIAPATIDTVFKNDHSDQWRRVLEASARLQVAQWF